MGGIQSYFLAPPPEHHVVVLGLPDAGRKTLARALLSQKHWETLQLDAAKPSIAGMEILTGEKDSY